MKKVLISLGCLIVMVAAFAGCGAQEEPAASASEAPVTSSAAATQEPETSGDEQQAQTTDEAGAEISSEVADYISQAEDAVDALEQQLESTKTMADTLGVSIKEAAEQMGQLETMQKLADDEQALLTELKGQVSALTLNDAEKEAWEDVLTRLEDVLSEFEAELK